jgi:hypothetical protein
VSPCSPYPQTRRSHTKNTPLGGTHPHTSARVSPSISPLSLPHTVTVVTGRCRHLWTDDETATSNNENAASGGKRAAKKAIDDEYERAEACKVSLQRTARALKNESHISDLLSNLTKAHRAVSFGATNTNRYARSDLAGAKWSTTQGAVTLPPPQGNLKGLKAHEKALESLEVQAPVTEPGPFMSNPPGVTSAEDVATDDGSTPPELYDLTMEAWRAEVAQRSRAAPDAPPSLSPEQRRHGREFLSMARKLVTLWRAGTPRGAAIQALKRAGYNPHWLLQGAGGTGKSVFFQALTRIMKRLALGSTACSAWTGVAAAPHGESTLCSMLKINSFKKDVRSNMEPKTVVKMQTTFALKHGPPSELLLFCIDEMSFLSAVDMYQIDQQLQRLTGHIGVPFGGVLVLFAGDFWQKGPPGAISLAKLLAKVSMWNSPQHAAALNTLPWKQHKRFEWQVDAPTGGQRGLRLDPNSADALGLARFRSARRKELIIQNRVANDPDFRADLMYIRRLDVQQPVRQSFVDKLKPLTVQDAMLDPTWLFARVGGCGNMELDRINALQTAAFAKAYNLVHVTWNKRLKGRPSEWIAKDKLDELYENEPGLIFHFVWSGPCLLNHNVAPHKELGNGTPGRFHSLSFVDNEIPPALAAAMATGQYAHVHLDEPPLSVNFVPDGSGSASGRETLVEGMRVIGIIESSHAAKFKCQSVFAAAAGIPAWIATISFPLNIAFAMTDFKLQGMTVEKLIMSVAKSPFPPPLDLEGFYVFISRLIGMNGLRVLHKPKGPDGLANLLDLQHAPELDVWYNGYDPDGEWDIDLARTVAAQRQPSQATRTSRTPPAREKPSVDTSVGPRDPALAGDYLLKRSCLVLYAEPALTLTVL